MNGAHLGGTLSMVHAPSGRGRRGEVFGRGGRRLGRDLAWSLVELSELGGGRLLGVGRWVGRWSAEC